MDQAYTEGKIRLVTHYSRHIEKGVLGDYRTQTIVKARLGRIEQNKQVQVVFDFEVPPDSNRSVEIFLNNEYLPMVSIVPVPRLPEVRDYSRVVMVYGDGTDMNLFLRPYSMSGHFEISHRRVTWREV